MKILALIFLMVHAHPKYQDLKDINTQAESSKPPKVVIMRKHTGDRPKYLGHLPAPFLYSQLDNK